MNCPNCEMLIAENTFKCPNCQSVITSNQIIFEKKDGLTKTTSKHLALMRNKALLEKLEKSDFLMEGNFNNRLTIDDMSNSVDNFKLMNTQELEKLEHLLLKNDSEINLQGLQITTLIKGNADNLKIIRTGIKFLKYNRFKEAIEWWTLNRNNLASNEKSLFLLLLIFEAFTYQLSGNKEKFKTTQDAIKNHPLFSRYSQ